MKLRDFMPEFEGATSWINGEVTQTDLIGEKPTLVHFWSISCALCKEDMPQINTFRDQYQDSLNVVAVHMPRSEKDIDPEEIKAVAKQHSITQAIIVDSEYRIADAFDNQDVPAYYVFDYHGRLSHFQAGHGGMGVLTRCVNRVLQESKEVDS